MGEIVRARFLRWYGFYLVMSVKNFLRLARETSVYLVFRIRYQKVLFDLRKSSDT